MQGQPMAPGGAWMKLQPDAPPTYVVHEAHVKRLLGEGGQIVADPRPGVQQAHQQAEQSVEIAMRAEIERLRAELAHAQQALEHSHASTQHDEPAHSTRETADRRSGRK